MKQHPAIQCGAHRPDEVAPPAPLFRRSAVVFELAARLDQYDADLRDIGRCAFDAARLRCLADDLREICRCSVVLPQFAADVMQITISHFELVRLLCRPRLAFAGAAPQDVPSLLERQCEAVRIVRGRCLRLIARRPDPRGLNRFTRL